MSELKPPSPKHQPVSKVGLVGWMAMNAVASNIVMAALVILGLLTLNTVRQEVFPSFSNNIIGISVSYPGASPEEVEEGVVLAIESEVRSIDGVAAVRSSASEGSGTVSAELLQSADPGEMLQYVKNAIDQIRSFPDDAEEPRVRMQSRSRFLVSIGLSGDIPELEMANLADDYVNRLLTIDGVSQVLIRGERAKEITIEIPRDELRSRGMTLGEVAQSVARSAQDVPAGSMETSQGEYLLRTEGRKVRAADFEQLPLAALPDGSKVLLGDVAQVREGFEDVSLIYEYDGSPGLRIDVFQSETAKPIDTAKLVNAFLEAEQARLPSNVTLRATRDFSTIFQERAGLLIKNGAMGLLLVLLLLGVFLKPRLAFWVSISIPVVLIGAVSFMPALGVSINMISMFAFIMTLGIVVDDSIIIGENIYARHEEGMPVEQAVLVGAREMSVPIFFSVATNMVAFVPLMLVPGETGKFLQSMPIVACAVFLVSLIEALFVLPSHVHHALLDEDKAAAARGPRKQSVRERIAGGLDWLRDKPYAAALKGALVYRYVVMAMFIGICAIMIAWQQTGRIDFNWRPQVPGDRVDAELQMPADASFEETRAVARRIEAAGLRAIEELGGRQYVNNWFLRIRADRADVNIELVGDDERPFTQDDMTRVWRKQLGEVPEARSLIFEFMVGPGGNGLDVRMSHPSNQVLEEAAMELADELRQIQGLVDITDGVAEGKRQLRFTLTAEARALNLNETSLGRQIRHAYYGAEALRLLRDRSEIKVMVRLPREERQSLASLADYVVQAPGGVEIPLSQAAEVELGRAFSSIRRRDGQREIEVHADLDRAAGGNRQQVSAELKSNILPELRARYPGLTADLSSGRRGRDNPATAIGWGLAGALVVIFAFIAALFRSYSQGLIVMMTIPFSVAAAVFGHIILGRDLSSVSIYGMIALCGLVVNGALVLTLRFNQMRDRGLSKFDALLEAGRSRFRPIVLTSMTTTVGLGPMLFETSVQAMFLVPMAIALSFGTVFSTFVILFFIPCLHMAAEDLRYLTTGERAETAPAE